jgi:hypothetical protein
VVWQGSVGDRRPYADLTSKPEVMNMAQQRMSRTGFFFSVNRRSDQVILERHVSEGTSNVQADLMIGGIVNGFSEL